VGVLLGKTTGGLFSGDPGGYGRRVGEQKSLTVGAPLGNLAGQLFTMEDGQLSP
jgi:hypothetical protein